MNATIVRRIAFAVIFLTSFGIYVTRASVSGALREPVSAPGTYAGYSEKLYEEHALESRYVQVRDGTKLAVDIFRPAVDGKAVEGRFPLVWMHTPYSRALVA